MEIGTIRSKYGISQTDLSTILGWGGKTITRYESHQVQDAAHDFILRKIDDDPECFLWAFKETLPGEVILFQYAMELSID